MLAGVEREHLLRRGGEGGGDGNADAGAAAAPRRQAPWLASQCHQVGEGHAVMLLASFVSAYTGCLLADISLRMPCRITWPHEVRAAVLLLRF